MFLVNIPVFFLSIYIKSIDTAILEYQVVINQESLYHFKKEI